MQANPSSASLTSRLGRMVKNVASRTCLLTLLSLYGADLRAQAAGDGESTGEVIEEFALERKPRWEVGVGGGYLDGFDYPASEDPNRAGIALPYFIYRSPVFRVGDGGVGAVALERARVRLDLSLGGSLSASSEGNSARDSMPDLDFLFEFGPKLDVQLYERDSPRFGRTLIGWSAKVRAVVATDLKGFDSAGFVFASGFRLTQRDIFGSPVDLLANLEATVATEKLHDYFYEVADRFETPDRPAYDAQGGYLGTRLFLALAYRPIDNVRLFAGVGVGQYAGAANEDSPLFETRTNTGIAFGFAWRLFESKDSVQVMDTD